jgi:hypothetical protein
MITILNLLLAFVSGLLLPVVVTEKDGKRQRNITMIFVSMVFLIVCMNTLF